MRRAFCVYGGRDCYFWTLELIKKYFGWCAYTSCLKGSKSFLLPRLFLLLLVLVQVTGCGAATTAQIWDNLLQQANDDGFKATSFTTKPFILTGLMKGHLGASSELVVYLEGDGRGIINGRISRDPSPHLVMGYELARFDPAPSVLYLARVGQFQPSYAGTAYQPYWANKRLARESVEAASQALDQAKVLLGATHLHLIGYSGGGGLALLLAEQRRDVLSVATVAGLLDIRWWVEKQKFLPLVGSLNPADKVATIANLPQVHFFGTRDTIIPPDMSAHFQTLTSFTNFQRVEMNTDHWAHWVELWPSLLEDYLVPLRSTSTPVMPSKLHFPLMK